MPPATAQVSDCCPIYLDLARRTVLFCVTLMHTKLAKLVPAPCKGNPSICERRAVPCSTADLSLGFTVSVLNNQETLKSMQLLTCKTNWTPLDTYNM